MDRKIEKYNSWVACVQNKLIFQGVRQAEKAMGIDHSNISKNCKGIRKSARWSMFSIL